MVMEAGRALNQARARLKAAGISGTADLDALVLMEDVTGIDRARLLAEPAQKLTLTQLRTYNQQINQRRRHIPLAYIRKQSEFYGRTFYIDKRVLEPRPESEAMIDEAKSLIVSLKRRPLVIDIGTGSGALIISLKLELPLGQAVAIDLSQDCLDVAKINMQKFALDIEFRKGDLIDCLPDKLFQINRPVLALANLPYVPNNWKINEAAMQEPRMAIFGGGDGLDLYRTLFKQLTTRNNPVDYLLCESMPPQHATLAELATIYGYKLIGTNDFIQVFSCLA